MLVRCSHCSAVFPDDVSKCPKCGTAYTPPPPPPQPLPTSDKENAIVASVAVFGALITIILFTIGMILLSMGVALTLGLILSLTSIIGIIVTAGAIIKLKQMHDHNVSVRTPTTDVSPEEYEQRIRDFINNH